jgi:hypothetical protein
MKKALILALIGFTGAANANLIVTDNNDPTALTNALIGVSSGISIVGAPTIIAGTNFAGATQSGTFTNGLTGGLGFDAGIILTTGTAETAESINNSDSFSEAPGTGSNAFLDAQTGTGTNDQNVLEFEFTTSTGDLFFDYIFASEEYNEFVDSTFNDGFALLVDGVNIALLPDGTTPVTINNLNCGNPFGSADDFCSLYNNNDLQDGGPFFDIQYDGFTDVLNASITGLDAGNHTMTFAIADAGDSAYDSAVFIKAGSFTDTDPCVKDPSLPGCNGGTVPEPSIIALFAAGLFGLGFARRRMRS